MKLITLYLPEPYIKALDKLVNERFYPNRAEAIRVAIRDMLNVEAWRTKPNG
jgi:Arc/MetJ-type ribon-helix-helix transcriptional regulator